jgi:DNA (cytosine-5)-methyltransferase 1
MHEMPIKFIDLFSGIGGFRLGLEKVDKDGFRCVWSCDWDKYANQVYAYHWGRESHFSGDIRQFDAADIPDFDLLCAGFPCQSFSLAGKRQGFQDIRGTMFYEIARIAEVKRPRLLLLENVKGLLSTDEGRCFATILRTLEELGYLIEWQVLNSKHHGVPQNRERVFIVGHLGERGGREIFPVTSDDAEVDEVGTVARTLQGGGHSGGLHSNMTALVQLNDDGGSQVNRVYSPEGASPTIPTAGGGRHIPKIDVSILSHSPRTNDPKKGGSGPLISDEYCFTLDSTPHNLIGNARIRRLTPVECERLQGFPDGWTARGLDASGKEVTVSDTQRYKMLGNAVTVNVIEFLGKRVLEKEA